MFWKKATNNHLLPVLGLAVWGVVAVLLMSLGRATETTLWIAAFFWGVYMSSQGYRWFYLIAALVFAAIGTLWGDFGEVWNTAAIGLAFAATGLMDHLLLRRLLPPPPAGEAVPGLA